MEIRYVAVVLLSADEIELALPFFALILGGYLH